MITLERVKKLIRAKEKSTWRVCESFKRTNGKDDVSFIREQEIWSTLFEVLQLMEDEDYLNKVEEIYYDK